MGGPEFGMLRCPTCGSPEVYLATGGNLGQIYLCHACGYRGSFILECDPPAGPGDDEHQAK
jgi:transposase-like protein